MRILAALFGLLFAASCFAVVLPTYDRFTGKTTYTIKGKAGGLGKMDFYAVTTTDKTASVESTNYSIGLLGLQQGWRYLKCNTTHWLVDDQPFDLPAAKHGGEVAQAGMVVEELIIPSVSEAQMRALAKAKKIEYEICNDQFEVASRQIEDIRELFNTIDAARGKQP